MEKVGGARGRPAGVTRGARAARDRKTAGEGIVPSRAGRPPIS